jgi:CHASE2 domain-containing sensor protein
MGSQHAGRLHLRALALAALAAIALAGAAFESGALSSAEGQSLNTRFGVRGAQRPGDVAVVAVDERTFSDLRLQWPFRRALHARLIDRLRADGAKVIVYDVQFTEPTDSADDLALYESIARAGHVVLATTEVDAAGHTDVLGGEANLRAAGAMAAASNLPPDSGGVIRRYPYSLLGLPSLAVAAARRAGHPIAASRFSGSTALIDFRGPPATIPTYSFSQVLAGGVDPRLLAGRVVVVGAAAPTLQDVHQTSTTTVQPMSGPELQANAIWSALHGNPLRAAPDWTALLAIVLCALLAPLAAVRLRPLAAAAISLLGGAAYLLLSQLLFEGGVVVAVAGPLLALVLGGVGMLSAGYLAAFIERNQFLRQLRASQLELIQRLAQAVEHRDAETGAHIRRIGLLCERLARAVGWSEREAEMLRHASAMHDVGKIGIPDTILLKPDKLDEREWEVVRSHTTIGGRILADSANPLVRMAATIARSHHERWDGSGYPDGLSGEAIPESARICAVCDVFDALLSARAYKPAWRLEDAIAEIERGRGTHFDPRLVDAFIALVPSLLEPIEEIEQTVAEPLATISPLPV